MNKDWEYIKLSDACTIHGRIGWQGLTRAEHKRSGDYLLITGTDFTEDNKINLDTCVYVDEFRYTQDENIQIRKNDLLITKDGTLGKLALITEDLPKPATLNGGIFVIRDKINKLYPPFLLNYMKSDAFRKIIHNHRTGSTVPHLTQNMLVNFPIPVPPLEEQKRLVKILDEKFAQLETIKTNAQTNLQNAKDLFQSQLTKAFSKATWEKKRLDEVCSRIFAGGDKPQIVSKEISKTCQIPIFANAITDDGLYGYTNEATVFDKCLTISARGTIGFTCIRNKPFVPIVRLLVLIPKDGINISYLKYGCDTLTITNTGSSIPQLTVPMIKDYKIPLPPLSEQKRIVEELDTLSEKVRQLQEIYTKQIADCDELKQSLLQKAFTGEL